MASDGSWGVDRLVAAKGKVSFTLPDCIEAGDYLMRVEIIGQFALQFAWRWPLTHVLQLFMQHLRTRERSSM